MQWLLVHKMGGIMNCIQCGHARETIKHCLWDNQGSLIIVIILIEGFFSWGIIVWSNTSRLAYYYDLESLNGVLRLKIGYIEKVPFS